MVQYVLDLEIKGVNEDLANVFLANIGMLAK